MWRTLRQVFLKRSGSPSNIRLGQIQAAEKNDEVNPLSLSLEKERSVPRHGKALLQEHDLSQLEEGFDLVRSILIRARREDRRKVARLISYIGEEKEEENAGCGKFMDEIKLWFSGVLALTSILSCRHFIFDEDHKIDITRIPQALYYLTIHNPRSALAVLPVVPSDQALEDSNNESQSLNKAASTFEITSDQCTAECQNKLGVKYAAKRQYQEAFALFQQASVHGHSLAQFNLGLCYENGKGIDRDLVKSAECYKKAAAFDHSGAFYNLALFHMEGIGGLPKDHTRALELLELAAKSGLKKAQSYLGIYYANESSDHVDYSKAVSYLEKAASKKDADAEYHLGICYERGLGVERNLEIAAKLYKAAANRGSVSAQYNLGVFYQHGLGGLAVDNKEAQRYYKMAAEAGDEDACHNYLQLMKETTSDKKMNSLAPFVGNDILLAFFQRMTFKQNNVLSNQGILRCSSSPELLDQGVHSQDIQSQNQDSGSPLIAF